MARTFGALFVVLGCSAAVFPHPVGGLLLDTSVPIFLVSWGVLLLAPDPWRKSLGIALGLFLISFVGLQIIATMEAHHARDQKEKGVLAIWHQPVPPTPHFG